MARTAGDVGMPSSLSWPPAGWHIATCMSAARWKSPKKKTPAVMLRWATPDGLYEFEDPIFVTPKAVSRLNLVAQRVCGMPADTPLDEDNAKVASFLARYILENAAGKQAEVDIAVEEQVFIHTAGPNVGQKGYRQQSRVSFGGYRVPEGATEPVPAPEPEQPDPADDPSREYDPGEATEGDIPF